MAGERRGASSEGLEMSSTNREERQPYALPKWLVYQACARVKANHGAAGVDDDSLVRFAEHLKDNLYKM